MSTKAVRRSYKERAQPKQREKWGILEKHKDYSLRAKNYNEKKRNLRILRQKAADRNPDEFHFAMMSSKSQDGGARVASRDNEALSQTVVRLLKTQDATYLRTAAQKTRKAIQQLQHMFVLDQNSLPLPSLDLSDEYQNHRRAGRVAFVDSAEEQEEWLNRVPKVQVQQQLSFDAEEHQGQIEEDKWKKRHERFPSTSAHVRSRNGRMDEVHVAQKQRAKQDRKRKATLEALVKREKSLRAAETELGVQREKLNQSNGMIMTRKGSKFTVKGRKR